MLIDGPTENSFSPAQERISIVLHARMFFLDFAHFAGQGGVGTALLVAAAR